jgi:hypothetical protein
LPGLRDLFGDAAAGVELPAEQLAVVTPQSLRVGTDDLEVNHWLTHVHWLPSGVHGSGIREA